MRHLWTLICTDSSIDAQSNNISLFKVIERLQFELDVGAEQAIRSEFGGQLMLDVPFQVVTTWMRSDLNKPETFAVRLIAKTPSNNDTPIDEYGVDLSVDARLRRIRRKLHVPYEGDGLYWFMPQIQQDDTWVTVAEIPLEIIYS